MTSRVLLMSPPQYPCIHYVLLHFSLSFYLCPNFCIQTVFFTTGVNWVSAFNWGGYCPFHNHICRPEFIFFYFIFYLCSTSISKFFFCNTYKQTQYFAWASFSKHPKLIHGCCDCCCCYCVCHYYCRCYSHILCIWKTILVCTTHFSVIFFYSRSINNTCDALY